MLQRLKLCFQLNIKYLAVKKVKQLGLSFQKFWKDAIIFNTYCGMKKKW